jgi:hypothetical protein
MEKDTAHLEALYMRLSWNAERLVEAKAAGWDRNVAHRERAMAQIRKEIDGEYAFLGMLPMSELPAMSDDEILKELGID